MIRKILFPCGMILLLATFQVFAEESEISLGQYEYESNCAICHGLDGGGAGPYAGLLTLAVPDLRTLQKNNKGVFPFDRIYKVIDGRLEIVAHGPRDMPIWGLEYYADAIEMRGIGEYYGDREAYIRARILALIFYISTLQKK